MEVPKGFLVTLWSFISFLPFFFLLLALGIVKAAAIGPVVVVIVVVGNSSVIIGMWPAHFIWTYYCVMKTKRLGLVLKIFLLVLLPVPLLLWPVLGILGSLLVGIGYGFFAPLIATFEAVGEDVVDKFYHCFALPSCLLVALLAILVDTPMISILALCKSPYMLVKGWQRLFHDLIGREGPFLETVCVPFAGLAIVLWPLAVAVSVITAFLCSFLLGLYGGVVVHQENSLLMGFAYIVSVISIFDEYTNDLLYLREGSWLPRPRYRIAQVNEEHLENENEVEQNKTESVKFLSDSNNRKLVSERSRTMKKAIQQLKPIQIWDWLFRSCDINGRMLLSEGLITVADIEGCIVKGKCKKLSIKLPSWCILQCLLRSAKSDSYGLLISDEVELTNFNWPKDKVLDWILGPLLIMKDQIRRLQLDENEEACLKKLILISKNEKPEDWDEVGFPSNDNVRRAQLQAIFRRLQGIVANMSRIPSFWRRFKSLVKCLYLEAIETGALTETSGGSASGSRISRVNNDRKRQNKSMVKSSSLDIGVGGEIV